MNLIGMLLAAAVVGITGLIIGLLLGVAGKKFKVEVDEREFLVRDLLPGNNCGGCGYAGCDALAKAIANGEAEVNACPVGGEEVAKQIGEIMGVTSMENEKKVAFVKCAGTCELAGTKLSYYGIQDCQAAAVTPGQGEKACIYGCMGFGSCVAACPFHAIQLVDGIAKVDKEKCVACGKCVSTCPKGLIELVPYEARYLVRCNSKEKGKVVKAACDAGCIGCGLCTRVCEEGAVTVTDNLAYIDQELCIGCGKCAEKCPVHVIHSMAE